MWLTAAEAAIFKRAETTGYLMTRPGRHADAVVDAWRAWCEGEGRPCLGLHLSDPAFLWFAPAIGGRELTEESQKRLVLLLAGLGVGPWECEPGALWAELPLTLAGPVTQLLAELVRLQVIETRPTSPADAP